MCQPVRTAGKQKRSRLGPADRLKRPKKAGPVGRPASRAAMPSHVARPDVALRVAHGLQTSPERPRRPARSGAAYGGRSHRARAQVMSVTRRATQRAYGDVLNGPLPDPFNSAQHGESWLRRPNWFEGHTSWRHLFRGGNDSSGADSRDANILKRRDRSRGPPVARA